MVNVFAFGTLKRGFPLHEAGLRDASYLGEYRTCERFPALVAGPWYAPMMLDQPGTGLQVRGELYEVRLALLPRLDALESVGQPGNYRILVQVEPLARGPTRVALVYVKSRELAQPVHSTCFEDYQDRRFIAPSRRPPPLTQPPSWRAAPRPCSR